jgi:alpha-ketoglutarate-dependent taurine dioxygenase
LAELAAHRADFQQAIGLEGLANPPLRLPVLAAEIRALSTELLDEGHGFAILRGLASADFTPVEWEHVFWHICRELGDPMVQKAGNVRMGRVEDLGRPVAAGARYHETNAAGSVHTDSPIMPRVADYVGLLCVRPAANGGESKFVSVASVHNRLVANDPAALARLYEPFYFDRRIPPQDVSVDNPAYLRAPIFTYAPRMGDHGLALRWQAEYVWQAPRLAGVPALTPEQEAALRALDHLLKDEAGELTVRCTMRAGDIQLLNNRKVAHGRTAFSDQRSLESGGGRLMRRVWLRASSSTDERGEHVG